MKIVFICPFDLSQLTGTPISASSTIRAAKEFSDVVVVGSNHSTCLLAFTKKALNVLIHKKPDVVHCFTSVAILPALIFKLFSFRTKIVFEVHGWAWYETSKKTSLLVRFFLSILDYLGIWISSLIIVLSYKAKKFVVKKMFRLKKIVVLPCPVDFPNEFVPVPLNRPIRVAYLGNGSWWQGLPCLIESAKILQERQDIIFILAGFDATDEKKFQKLKNVHYKGKLSRKEVLPFLQGADLLVSPRVNQKVSDLQFPQKFSEYLSAGRPVISSAVGDQPRIINEGKCGFIVDDLTPTNFAKAITDFVDLSDEEKRVWGERAFSYAQRHFLFPVFSSNLKSFYLQYLK